MLSNPESSIVSSYQKTWSPGQIVPYPCVSIDAEFNHLLQACWKTFRVHNSSRKDVTNQLQELFTTRHGPGHYLPCLSVRSAFHTFLQAAKFPKGSEIIMSAINVADMALIARSHGLHVVPVDISIETLGPKAELLELLINERTVAILVAHLFGRWHDVMPALEIAKQRNLVFIEDAAQAFNGFHYLGHHASDLILLSFGTIKNSTSFGGAIAKVKDKTVFDKMLQIQNTFPLQSNKQYFMKILRSCLVYPTLHFPLFNKSLRYIWKLMGLSDYRKFVFSPGGVSVAQPSSAMLATMLERLQSSTLEEQAMRRVKAEFVCHHLPQGTRPLGMKAKHVDYWLFPILVTKPKKVVQTLNELGVDATLVAGQLQVIEPEERRWQPPSEGLNSPTSLDMWSPMRLNLYPREARYLLDHIVYLPVNKWVPFEHLLFVCQALRLALAITQDDIPLSVTSRLAARL